MSAWDLVLAALLALLGGYLAVSAFRAWPLVSRLRRAQVARIAHLASGGASVSGTLRAVNPVMALDGSPAVVVRRTLRCRKVVDEESVTVVSATQTECAEAEVQDVSGACAVRLDHLLILAPARSHTFTGDEFAARHPDLLSSVPGIAAGTVVEKVVAEEQVIPDGARCFLSGSAAPGEAGAHDRPLRGRARELRGEPDLPLVVSCWDQAAVVRHLQSPVLWLAWLALLALVLAGLAVAVPIWLVS